MEITIRPSIKQHIVYQALNDPKIDEVFFGGGAGGGKTWAICESRLMRALMYPGYRSFIGRKELKRLMQSTYVTWTKVCQEHKIPQDSWKLNGQYNFIEFTNGSRIDLLDVDYLPSDPLYERFGSLEYTDGALEECGEIHSLAHDVLKTRIGRHKNREFNLKANLLLTGNPSKNWTYSEFYKPWKEKELPEGILFVQALYMDNKFTAEEYGKQLSQVKDKATKERLMFGNWEYDDDPTALLEYDAILDLFTNHIQTGNRYLVCDVARLGNDKTTITIWNGLLAEKCFEYQKQTTDRTVLVIKELEFSENIPRSHVLIDEDGIGGGVVDNLPGCKGFVANSRPIEGIIKENYVNLKAQCAWRLADLVNSRLMGVRCDDLTIKEKIIGDLEQIKRKDADKDGKLKLVPKEYIKELLGRSPDWGDNLLLRAWFEVNKSFDYSSAQAIVFVPKFK
jgi:phage terminase large subunit